MLTLTHDSPLPNPGRGWATLTSFAMQATAVAVALFIPLLRVHFRRGSDSRVEKGWQHS